MKHPCLYILASKKNGTLYIGVTGDIVQRIHEHKSGVMEGFTKKYNISLLVYYEQHETIEVAIIREKQLKKWNRQWKIELIEKDNLQWLDLSDSLM
ncbi:MAG: GIY-YIG nuclease family protein [Alphaproteobacteria bacterium]|nr:GIY-YIG nuclease family protein [Alphaproteobacteria bacterium]